MDGDMASFNTYVHRFLMGLRGFHVYREEWNPYMNENISFMVEENNPFDDFATAGFAGEVMAGHVP